MMANWLRRLLRQPPPASKAIERAGESTRQTFDAIARAVPVRERAEAEIRLRSTGNFIEDMMRGVPIGHRSSAADERRAAR